MVSADDSFLFFFTFFTSGLFEDCLLPGLVYYCPAGIAVSGASLLLMCCAHASTQEGVMNLGLGTSAGIGE